MTSGLHTHTHEHVHIHKKIVKGKISVEYLIHLKRNCEDHTLIKKIIQYGTGNEYIRNVFAPHISKSILDDVPESLLANSSGSAYDWNADNIGK